MLMARYAPGLDAKDVYNWTTEELDYRTEILKQFLENERKL